MKKLIEAYRKFAILFGFILLLFTILRIAFYLFNFSLFPDAELINFIGGIRFDWMTATIVYSPFLLLLPFQLRKPSKLLHLLFYFSTILAVVLSILDLEYYKFTLKRTTADLFTTKGIAEDIGNLALTFIIDYWYLILLAFISFWLIIKAYHKISLITVEKLSWKQMIPFLTSIVILYGVGVRGGIQIRPLNLIQASKYADAKNLALVLNTPFTIMKTIYKEELMEKNYFSEEELSHIYTPVHQFEVDSAPKKLNVVLIIAESFSKEYIGALNDFEGYTPFLDSLIDEGLIFTNAFANGKKSIESLPSIISGIPSLMDESYISGLYGGNKIESLPSFLSNKGYSTTFFHGGKNGTMGFQAFTQIAGMDKYVGRNEYPSNGDYDGNWGIFDEPFLQFCASELNKEKKPFFASIFTLSSHHPYTIPKQYEGKFKKGPLPILESVEYADYALSQFFETVKKEDWFEETLFIITADHTSHYYHEEYSSTMANYRIPILFYSPKYIDKEVNEQIVQQNDLFPSIIDFLGFEGNLIAFGNSIFRGPSFSISYLNNYYQLVEGDYCIQYNGENTIALYNWKEDPALEENIMNSNLKALNRMENKIKAIIQQYNNRLINNELVLK